MQATSMANTQNVYLYTNKHLVLFCTVFVFLYALTRFWIGAKISAYFEAAFLLPFYYVIIKNWWYFKKQFLTWLVIATLAIPLLQFFVQYYQDPTLAIKYQKLDILFRLTFFLAPAFWLAHNLKLITWFIAANLIGFYILLSTQNDPINSILAINLKSRNIFKGIHHEFLPTYAGVALISSIFLLAKLKTIKYAKTRNFIGVTLILSITLCSMFIAFSQTRAIILGLIAAVAFTAIYFRKNKIVIFAATVAFIAIISITLTSNIGNRIEKEAIAFSEYVKGERTIPKDNTGYRLLSWKIGVQHIIDKPLIGLGGKANKDAMVNSPEADSYMRKDLHHFHNSIIEFGIAYGLFGALFIAASILLLLKYANTKGIPPRIWIYSSALFVFLYTINFFESYFFYWQGGYLLIWSIAPLAAYIFTKNITMDKSAFNRLDTPSEITQKIV